MSDAPVSSMVFLLEKRPLTNSLVEELIHIDTDVLNIVLDTQVQTRRILESHQHDDTQRETPGEDSTDLSKLSADLNAVSVDGAGGEGWNAVESRHPVGSEDTGEESTDHAADAVELENL